MIQLRSHTGTHCVILRGSSGTTVGYSGILSLHTAMSRFWLYIKARVRVSGYPFVLLSANRFWLYIKARVRGAAIGWSFTVVQTVHCFPRLPSNVICSHHHEGSLPTRSHIHQARSPRQSRPPPSSPRRLPGPRLHHLSMLRRSALGRKISIPLQP